MKVIDVLNKSNKTLFSFELLPPLKGKDIGLIYETIDPLVEFNPAFISVTYHREEFMYKRHKNGLLEKRAIHKRPGTVAISAAIKYKYQITVLPHMICGGFSRSETENALIDLNFLGINNVLALRGDPMPTEKLFIPEEDGHNNAIDLVKQIVAMNKGKYIDEDLENTTATNFSAGVAGYPEKHIEAPNLDLDLKYLKEKIDAGAEYIITQMFFDNKKYFDFVDRCRKIGINVPIIPGIKPISTKKHLKMLPSTFNIDLPTDLVNEVEKCKDTNQINEIGIEWATMQAKELIKNNVPVVHFYTMGKAANVKRIVQSIF
jgi:methylenetetrahydrofolate reductase (NADPH)